jgi:group I intron endonuclease
MNSGIYIIYFDNTDRVYIGKSSNIEDRWSRHLNELKNDKHHSYKLQEYYNLGNKPLFSILVYANLDDLTKLEVFYISEFNAFIDGFNCTNGEGTTGTGYGSSQSRYSKDIYYKIVKELAYTNNTYDEISTKFNVTKHVINNIATLRRHGWIKEEMPFEYEILEIKRTISKPRGNTLIYENIFKDLILNKYSISQLAIKHNTSEKIIQHIKYGETHKWLQDKFPKEYKLLNI